MKILPYGISSNSLVFLLGAFMLSGCASLMSSVTSGMAEDLASSMLNSDDPETVKAAVPAYLLMVDSFIKSSPDDVSLLMSASSLNGSFTLFVDEKRTRLLSTKSLKFAKRAACLEVKLCEAEALPFSEFQKLVSEVSINAIKPVYTLGVAWATWIQAHADDWDAIAQLSRVRSLIARVIELDETFEKGNAHLYMGGLETLLPASLGGNPEKGKQHFEKAIELGQGANLMAKVVYAGQYARLVFDKDLHDRLLREVVASDPVVENMTLVNTIAQEQARQLLTESDDYF